MSAERGAILHWFAFGFPFHPQDLEPIQHKLCPADMSACEAESELNPFPQRDRPGLSLPLGGRIKTVGKLKDGSSQVQSHVQPSFLSLVGGLHWFGDLNLRFSQRANGKPFPILQTTKPNQELEGSGSCLFLECPSLQCNFLGAQDFGEAFHSFD